MNITIRKTSASDEALIREMMLKALNEDPDAYTLTYEEASVASGFWWRSYLQNYLSGVLSHMYMAFDGSEPVGMIGVTFDSRERLKHYATVVWFHVLREHRKQGVGKQLFNHLLEVLKNKEGIEKAGLIVSETQNEAVKLYEKFGFKIVGRQTRHIHANERYIDCITMEKFI